MELSEIKNQLASLMNFSKINVSSAAGEDAFAQLLSKNTEVKEAPVRDVEKKPVAEKKDTAKADNGRLNEDKKASAQDDKKRPEMNEDNSEKVSKPEQDVASKKENSSAADGIKKQENVAEKGEVVADVAEKPQIAEDKGNDDVAAIIAVPLNDLSLMGMINVVNPQTGEMMQMTGADLAEQLASGENMFQVNMIVPQDGSEPIFTLTPISQENNVELPQANTMENLMQTDSEKGVELKNFVAVSDEETVQLSVDAANSNVENKELKKQDVLQKMASDIEVKDVVDQKTSDQAAKLSEVLGKDAIKTEVKVSVKEEKISQLSSSDLLANTGSVADSVAIQTQNGSVEELGTAKNLNVMPTFNAMTQGVVEGAVQNSAPVAQVETSTANLNTTIAAGSEFVRAAKADASAESNQTSFRDIYKGMSKEIIDQVKVNITKSAVKGVDKIDISLKPVDLGHIEVKMQIGKDGKLQAHIISSRPETMDVLQREIQTLEKAFNDAGFQTDSGSLSFSFRGGNQANQNQGNDNGLRNFIGDIFEKEASNDLLAGDAFQGQSWDGTTGLNIRV